MDGEIREERRLHRGAKDLARAELGFLSSVFGRPEVFQEHLRELDGIARVCGEKRAKLLVVVFPYLAAQAETAPLTEKVVEALSARGIKTLDLTGRFQGRPVREIIVNSLDAHPNERVHGEIADLVMAEFLAAEPSAGGRSPPARP